MEDQPDSLELHRRRLGVPRLPPPPPPPGDEDLPPPEDEDPRPPEDEDVLDLLRREEEAECDVLAAAAAENLMGKEAEGDVDFDDGLLPEEEEEDVEMLSDDKVFQALNEDLSAM